MSRPKLISFLEKLKKELARTSSSGGSKNPANFKLYNANVAQNSFFFSPKELRGALKQEFDFRDLGHLLEDGTELSNWVKTQTDNMLRTLRAQYRSGLEGRKESLTMSGNQNYMMVTLQTAINTNTGKGYDNFEALRRQYVDDMNTFAKALSKKISDLGEKLLKTRIINPDFDEVSRKRNKNFKLSNNKIVVGNAEVSRGSDLTEAGHDKGFEIMESRIQSALEVAFNDEYPRRVNREILNSDLKKLGLDLSIERNDITGEYHFRMQSRVDNQQEGFLSAKQREDFNKQLANAVKLLNNEESILNLQGSPSMLSIKNNETIVKTLTAFEGIKNVEVKKPKKIKKTKKKPVVSKSKGRVTKKNPMPIASVAVRKINLKKAKKRKEGSGSASQPLRMLAMINKELPDTVKKNMKEPALVNRTGRFADSVRLTDVTQTPQGYPSFGYTYQRNPYQVFEEGSSGNWSNGNRDPRELIDRSIREIAAQLAIGRFYTRRV